MRPIYHRRGLFQSHVSLKTVKTWVTSSKLKETSSIVQIKLIKRKMRTDLNLLHWRNTSLILTGQARKKVISNNTLRKNKKKTRSKERREALAHLEISRRRLKGLSHQLTTCLTTILLKCLRLMIRISSIKRYSLKTSWHTWCWARAVSEKCT